MDCCGELSIYDYANKDVPYTKSIFNECDYDKMKIFLSKFIQSDANEIYFFSGGWYDQKMSYYLPYLYFYSHDGKIILMKKKKLPNFDMNEWIYDENDLCYRLRNQRIGGYKKYLETKKQYYCY